MTSIAYDCLPDSSPPDSYPCTVLLGPDHVGKTCVARAMLRRGFHVVSCEDDLLDLRYDVVRHIRRSGLQLLSTGASRDMIITGLELQLYCLRDEMMRLRASGSVVMDAYYYKTVAKCRLNGLADGAFLKRWRHVSPPDHVIHLRARPDVLWERAQGGALVNKFECFGNKVTRDGFVRYQEKLVELLQEEAQGISSSTIDAEGTTEEVCSSVERVLRSLSAKRQT